jgi:hypothetical protein
MIPEQQILDTFEAARDTSEQRRREDMGRHAVGISGWLLRRLTAERDHAERILAAASLALSRTPLPR